MEIRITTNQILKVLQILSWIIFIGLCIEACGIAFGTFYTFFINSVNTQSFWEGMNLASLYNFDPGYFLVITFIMLTIAVLKAILFYLIAKLFSEKKLNVLQPFSEVLKKFILLFSYLALGIGIFCNLGFKYSLWVEKQGVLLDNIQLLRFAGADVWLFMTVVLFVIAQLVKKGIEIQNENDLTI